MRNLDRRKFLATALGGIGGLGLASCVDSPAVPTVGIEDEILADVDANGIHLRQNIYCLNEYSPDLVAYRAGVAVMKSRPASNPTSWLAQRAIHWTNLPLISGMIANQCQHGTQFFLSWHRMYIYWFERIVRAASGCPTFALPYWGYSPTGQRDLPLPFRSPADPVNNVLYVSQRDPAVNAGTPLAAGVVDAGVAMGLIPFNSFQLSLEGTPHGQVHTAVGGGFPNPPGWMSQVPTAALDPIFYLHHANIDRLWGSWLALGGGRANPTSGPWMTQVWNFYNEYGVQVGMTGAQIIDTVQQLCYRYVKCSPVVIGPAEPLEPTLVSPLDADAEKVSGSVAKRTSRSTAETIEEAQVSVRLGNKPVEVSVPLSEKAQESLRAFEGAASGNDIVLHLHDVALLQSARVYYEVYANLDADARDTTYSSPLFVGNLDFFGIEVQSATADSLHAGHGGSLRRLSLLRVYSYLRSRGAWGKEDLRLTFVPRGYTEDVTDVAKVLPGDQAVIGRISIQLQ